MSPRFTALAVDADLEDGPDYVGEGGEDAGPGGVTVVLYQNHVVAVKPELKVLKLPVLPKRS